MVRPGGDKPQGEIEVDETLVGGVKEGIKGRQTESKVLVLVLSSRDLVGYPTTSSDIRMWANTTAAPPDPQNSGTNRLVQLSLSIRTNLRHSGESRNRRPAYPDGGSPWMPDRIRHDR
jgi:hypothetical protein